MKLFVSNEEVASLEAALQSLDGAAYLHALVSLAWHLRQRDTKRALALADEAAALLADSGVRKGESIGIEARLHLVRGEAKWLHAELDDAERHAQQALRLFGGLSDYAGSADACGLLGWIASERGEVDKRVSNMRNASHHARLAGDTLRRNVAEVVQLRWMVFTDVQAAEREWEHRFAAVSFDNDPAFGSWADDFLGLARSEASDFGRAAQHAMRAYESAMATGQVYRAIVSLVNTGVAFANLHDFHSALDWMQRALALARETGWPACIGMCLLQSSEPLRQLGSLDAAAGMLEEAIDLMRALERSRNYWISLEYLGNLELDRDRADAALRTYEQMETGTARAQQTGLNLIALRGKAQALSMLNRPAEAVESAQAALALAVKHRDAYNQIETLKVLADIHSRHALPGPEGMTAASAPLHYLHEALDVASRIEGYLVPGELLDRVASEYERAGDVARAYEYLLKANVARSRIHSQDATSRAIAMQVLHETENARAQIELQRQLAEAEARRAEMLLQTTETLERLSAIGQDITAHLEGSAVFEAIDRHVHGLLDATSFFIYLMDTDGRTMTPVFAMEDGKPVKVRRIAVGDPKSSVARAARERSEIVVDLAPNDPTANVIPGTLRTLSSMFAPLCAGEGVLGVMTIQSLRQYAYGERERMIFRTLCAYGAIALDNAAAYGQLRKTHDELHAAQAALVEKNTELNEAYRKLEDMSVTDPLTGLRNRRFITQQLDKDIAITRRRYAEAARRGTRETLINADMIFLLIDIDHFKSVNDTWGHAAGDAVLMQMRERLQKACRESDYLVRWGGEEFLVVARDARLEEAPNLAERIRRCVEEDPFAIDADQRITKTCSIGFTCFPFHKGGPTAASWLDVVNLADRALYMAKQNGRNAWVGIYPEAASAAATIPGPGDDLDALIADGSMVVVSSIGDTAAGRKTAI
jgi:diguanylate cyclase (GGDEF)-like protein